MRKLISGIICVVLLLVFSGCANVVSSAAESGLVFIVAKHDETVEKKQKKYTAMDRCVVTGEPEAIALGDAIVYGTPITAKYDRLLSRTGDGDDTEPFQPHEVAYAFYIIADEIHDSRGKERKEWAEKKMDPKEAAEIRSIIKDKYLQSHLEKCFAVPDAFKISKTTRQLIKEDQARVDGGR